MLKASTFACKQGLTLNYSTEDTLTNLDDVQNYCSESSPHAPTSQEKNMLVKVGMV